MWAHFVLDNSPARSILAAIVARVLSIRIKSRQVCETGLGRVEHACLGVFCDKDVLYKAALHLGRALILSGVCTSLTIVWLNPTKDGVETVHLDASKRTSVHVTSVARQVDAVIDLDSTLRTTNMAELQFTLAKWILSAPPGTPVVTLGVRWERVLALVDAGGSESFALEAVGPRVRVGWKGEMTWELPRITPGLWTSRFGSLSETAVECKLSRGGKRDDTQTVMAIPSAAWQMQAAYQSFVCVFDDPLDETAVRMSAATAIGHDEKKTDNYAEALDRWNEALPCLGTVSLNVWVHDLTKDVGGIWRAAMDAFKTGSSLWPV